MGVRNFLTLFFAAMAISLVILVVFFSLFFKNIDLSFNTKMPESAPNPLEEKAQPEITPLPKKDEHFKADGIQRSTVNVPSDVARNSSSSSDNTSSTENGPAIGVGADPNTAPKPLAPKPLDTTPLPSSSGSSSVEDVTPEMLDNAGGLTPSREVNAPAPGRGTGTAPAPHAPRISPRLHKPWARPAAQQPPSPEDTVQRSAPVPAPAPESTPDTPQSTPPVPDGTPSGALPGERHQVYMDQFATPQQAQNAAERLQAQGIPAIVRFNRNNRPMVQVGTFSNRNNAEQLASRTGAKLKTLP